MSNERDVLDRFLAASEALQDVLAEVGLVDLAGARIEDHRGKAWGVHGDAVRYMVDPDALWECANGYADESKMPVVDGLVFRSAGFDNDVLEVYDAHLRDDAVLAVNVKAYG